VTICPDCEKPDAVTFGDGGCMARCRDPHFRTNAKCMKDTIALLRSRLAWIPVEERLPDLCERVEIKYMTMFGPIATVGEYTIEGWMIIATTGPMSGNGVTECVTHWRAIPK
jgi:hypothetical protein